MRVLYLQVLLSLNPFRLDMFAISKKTKTKHIHTHTHTHTHTAVYVNSFMRKRVGTFSVISRQSLKSSNCIICARCHFLGAS